MSGGPDHEYHGLTQLGRHQHAAGGIHVHVHGVTEEIAAVPERLHGQTGNLVAERLPLGATEYHQTPVGVARDGELVLAFNQGVTVPGRHRQPPLGIEIERRNTLKHLGQS